MCTGIIYVPQFVKDTPHLYLGNYLFNVIPQQYIVCITIIGYFLVYFFVPFQFIPRVTKYYLTVCLGKKNACVFQVSALKTLGMFGRHYHFILLKYFI